jgi:hypothetical protein
MNGKDNALEWEWDEFGMGWDGFCYDCCVPIPLYLHLRVMGGNHQMPHSIVLVALNLFVYL